ncbi:MAG: cytochrome c-type biogenesis CcmF C-terminal domain-containing protein, partial [Anaerolineae bacterium]
LGTLWPTFTEALRGVAASLTAENYNRFMGPLGLVLVVLIGLCPLIDWRKISTERLLRSLWVQTVVALITAVVLVLFLPQAIWAIVSFTVSAFVIATILLQLAQGIVARMRSVGENVFVATAKAVNNNRRRYGGQLIHFSILLIVIGITGSQAYQQEVQVALAEGETVEVQGYTLSYTDYTYRQIQQDGNKVLNEAVMDVYRGTRRVATIRPQRNLHNNVQGAVTEVALRSNLAEDLYVVLASLEPDGLAAFQVIINPMVVWLWIGGVVMILGTLIATWPARRPGKRARRR